MIRSTATSTLAVDDLLDDLELPSGCFFSDRHRRAPADAKGVERGQMSDMRRFPEGLGLIFRNRELGLGWFPSNVIGRRGRCFWTASCTDSREQVSGVGGWSVRPLLGQVQRQNGEYGVRPLLGRV
jgi:hypothetical protein